MEKDQFASGVCGVGPAERTGKPRSRYCPGGSLPLWSLGFRRPRNPREMNPSLMFSPPDLRSLSHTVSQHIRNVSFADVSSYQDTECTIGTLSSPERAWRAGRTACGIGIRSRVRNLDRE